MSKPRVLIAGIGNIFLGDDGFGCEVARRLQLRSWPAEVRVRDFGIRGFDLAFALLDGYETAVLIDAVPRGGTPGTLYKIEPNLDEVDELKADSQMVETHGMNPLKVLAMVKSMGGQFEEVLIVGCEPTIVSPEGEMGLSPSVAAAIPEAVRMVESIVAEKLLASKLMVASHS